VGGVVVRIGELHLQEDLRMMERVQVSERRRHQEIFVAAVEGPTAAAASPDVSRRQRARGTGKAVVGVDTVVATTAVAHHDSVVALAKEGQIRSHGFDGRKCGCWDASARTEGWGGGEARSGRSGMVAGSDCLIFVTKRRRRASQPQCDVSIGKEYVSTSYLATS
jgi:hypothetical protein